MGQLITQRPMPKWLRRALKAQVLSYQEALAMWHVSLMAAEEYATAPEWLIPACERLHLLETPSARA